MTPPLWSLFAAGRVQRWHCNHLVPVEPVDAHAGRVARLIAMIWPGASARLLRAALAHDDGERAVGDLAYPAKRLLRQTAPQLIEEIEYLEMRARRDIHDDDPLADLMPLEAEKLAFADRLDAAMWVAATAPDALTRDDWLDDLDRLIADGHELGLPWIADFVADLRGGYLHA